MKKLVFFSFAAVLTYAAVFLGCKPKVEGTMSASDSTKTMAAPSPVERGKYLVNAVAGCGHCHTPWKMGEHGPEPDMSRMLSGSPEGMVMKAPKLDMPWMGAISATFNAFATPAGIAYAKNLTPDSATGIGKWDETTFILALRNGKDIGTGRNILPPMPWDIFKNMTDEDLKAIYAYLRTIPAIHNQPPDAVVAPPPPMAGGGMPPGAPEGKKK
jgi:hypothetical protein